MEQDGNLSLYCFPKNIGIINNKTKGWIDHNAKTKQTRCSKINDGYY